MKPRAMVGALVGLLVIVMLWQLVVVVSAVPSVVMPSPLEVIRTLIGFPTRASFWASVGTSLVEFLLGYCIGGALGIAIALLLHGARRARMVATPLLETFRFIVPFAWIPLTILWFGTSIWGKVWLVAYAVFFVMVTSTLDALTRVDPTLLRVGVMIGMSRNQQLIQVTLRAAAPSIANAARAGAALGWIAVVAAEYVGSKEGLGFMIINASSSLDTAVVIAVMVIIGLIGAGVSWLLGGLIKYKLTYR